MSLDLSKYGHFLSVCGFQIMFSQEKVNFYAKHIHTPWSANLLGDLAESARRMLRFRHGTRLFQSEGAPDLPFNGHNQ